MILTSLEILEEIHRVLEYERIGEILKKARTQSGTVMANILRFSSIVEVKTEVNLISEDPSDNILLACAEDGRAQFIVSGDKHLLQLGKYESVDIVTPARFLELYGQKRQRRQ